MNAFRHALTPARALLLAAALLLAQAAGLWHGVAHGVAPRALGHGHVHEPVHAHPHAHAHGHVHGRTLVPLNAPADAQALGQAPAELHVQAPAQPRAQAQPAGHGLHDHPQAGAECRLYDQLLGHADALLAPAPVLDTAGSTLATPRPAHTALAQGAAGAYQARAPPQA